MNTVIFKVAGEGGGITIEKDQNGIYFFSSKRAKYHILMTNPVTKSRKFQVLKQKKK